MSKIVTTQIQKPVAAIVATPEAKAFAAAQAAQQPPTENYAAWAAFRDTLPALDYDDRASFTARLILANAVVYKKYATTTPRDVIGQKSGGSGGVNLTITAPTGNALTDRMLGFYHGFVAAFGETPVRFAGQNGAFGLRFDNAQLNKALNENLLALCDESGLVHNRANWQSLINDDRDNWIVKAVYGQNGLPKLGKIGNTAWIAPIAAKIAAIA